MYFIAVDLDLYDEDFCSLEVHNYKKSLTHTIDSEEEFLESFSNFIEAGRTKKCIIIPVSYSLYQKYKRFIKNFNVSYSEKIETIKKFLEVDFPELII